MMASQTMPDLGLSEGGPFRAFDIESAHDFLTWLSPQGPILYKSLPTNDLNWVFRGIPNSEWGLIPSAFRNGMKLLMPYSVGRMTWQLLRPDKPSQLTVTNEIQTRAEFETLKAFFQLSDAQGFLLPEDSQRLRSYFTFFPNFRIFSLLKERLGRL